MPTRGNTASPARTARDQGTRKVSAHTERGLRFDLNYQHPDQGDDPTEDLFKIADLALVKEVARVLFDHYWHPGWRVEASHKEGLVRFNIPALMGDDQWGVVRIRDLETDPAFKTVVRVAGEILERYRIPRAGFNEADFNAAIARHPLGYRGAAVPT